MKKFINSPDTVLTDALAGVAAAHPSLTVDRVGRVITRAARARPGKVALISGGGSGHEPLHGGFVGTGMLDAACPGEVFTSPVPDQMTTAAKAVDSGAGVVFVVKNYTGDVMNFQLAAELAADEGINVATILVDDDVAVQDSTWTAGRRGTGATLLVEKIAGALAEKGGDLAAVSDLGTRVNAASRSFAVALTACFFQFMRSGGSCLLIPNPRDCDGMVKTLSPTRFTHLMGVNTLFNVLINHPKIGTVDFANLDFVVGGGTAVQRAVAERWKALTGNTIIEGYGLSETSPVVCVNPRGMRDFSGTIGYPLPSTEVSIRDISGAPLPNGQPGEICVRGPQVMRGYWNRPEETARAMTADGFFRTGDVAILQADGQVRIVDRMKDMILVSGFNVYPNEVEDVLAAHPAVLECAVVGAPSEETGEMVVAHVVLKDPAVSIDVLRAHARTQLTGYKVPRRVVLHETLPKTNVGKVLRRMLRDETPPA